MNRFITSILIVFATITTAFAASPIDFLLSQVRTSANGALVSGKVYFYEVGTTTPKAVYLNTTQTQAASNPYTLDANATAQLYGNGAYRFVIKDSAGVTKYDRVVYAGGTQVFSPITVSTATGTDNGGCATLSECATRADLVGATVTVRSPLSAAMSNISSATVHSWPSDRVLRVEKGGSIGNTTKFDIKGPFNAGRYQAFAGTGAVTFDSGVVSAALPEWWGAVGDNIVDSTSAIQSAINSLSNSGGTVSIHGKYKISSGLILRTAVTLWNESGQAERSNISNKSAAGLYCTGTGYDAVTIGTAGQSTSAMQAGLRGISIFNAPKDGIVINSFAATVDGCSVVHALGNGITVNTGVAHLLNTHIIGPAKHGIVLNAGDNKIINCEIQQPNSANGGGAEALNTYDCIHITTGAQQILNCRMGDDLYRSRDAIRVVNGGTVQIIGNDLQNFTQVGINLMAGNTYIITGNNISSASVDAAKTGILIDTSITTVVGNSFNGIAAGGVGAIKIVDTHNTITVSENSFFGNWAYPFNMVATTLSTIINSNFDNKLFTAAAVLSGATPAVNIATAGNIFKVTNGGATTVTNFTSGYAGQEIVLVFTDANTTLGDSGNLKLSAAFTSTASDTMRLVFDGTDWYEQSRSVN